ncbi:MAG: heavy-metal-associated domain-containing protein [Myxococcales bacterium]|nr:heavy-metal-associated domain-containing protein [Myxococcales bacterium]
MTKTYRVDGMTCQHCAASVTKAIKAIRPADDVSVEVDLEAKTVVVQGLDDDRAVSEAVEAAGFDFVG